MVSASSKKLLKSLPTEEVINGIIGRLKDADDTTLVFMCVSYLDYAAQVVLTSRFVTLNGGDRKRIFDAAANGILGTYSSKIRILFALNLIGPTSYADFQMMGDIRNVFAHTLHQVDFSHELVQEDCGKLRYLKQDFGVSELKMDSRTIFIGTFIHLYLGLRGHVYEGGLVLPAFRQDWRGLL